MIQVVVLVAVVEVVVELMGGLAKLVSKMLSSACLGAARQQTLKLGHVKAIRWQGLRIMGMTRHGRGPGGRMLELVTDLPPIPLLLMTSEVDPHPADFARQIGKLSAERPRSLGTKSI